MIVAIHQPNLFPWLGYFHKMLNSDRFVFLDHVRVSSSVGGTQPWFRRVRALVHGREDWVSVPVRGHGTCRGEEFPKLMDYLVEFPERIGKKHLKTWSHSYRGAPYYACVMPLLEEYYQNRARGLAERNIGFIHRVAQLLEIGVETVRSSELHCTRSSTELLIEICKRCDADIYLCGGGANAYQTDSLFSANNIELLHQDFQHPLYLQRCEAAGFCSGLSIDDAPMYLGFKGTRDLLDSSQSPADTCRDNR